MMQSLRNTPSIRFVYILNMLPVIGLMVYYYTHYLEGTYSFIIPLGLTMAWLALSLMNGKIKGILLNKVCIWWMIYLFLCVLMVIIGFSSTNLNFVISRLPIFLLPAIGYYAVSHYNRKEKTILLTAFAIVYFVNLIYNIFLGFQFPDIFEEQVSTEESIQFSTLMNIASTGFIVVGYCLIGALLMAALVVKEKGRMLLYLLLVVPIAYYMLFQNTRGTAVLLLVVELFGMFIAYFEPKGQGNKRGYYLFTTIMLVIMGLIVFIPLLTFLMEHLQSERLSERLNDLVDFKQSGGNLNDVREGSLTERILLAQTSLNSFFSSPISIMIGIGDHTQSFGGDLIKSGIGNHSEFIDVLARYGLVGAFVFWKIMKNYHWMLYRLTTQRQVMKYVNVIFVVIILSGILNNIFYPAMLFFIYLIFPVIMEFSDNLISYTNGK